MNALGIIFASHYSGSYLRNELTQARTFAALPIGGRYRIIDFILSSMANAGIWNVGIIVNENYGSLVNHLGGGEDWDLNRRFGGLTVLSPLSRPEVNTLSCHGRLDALRAIRGFIEDSDCEYVIMGFGGLLGNFDLAAMMESHRRRDAYLTLAYSHIPAGPKEAILTMDDEERISGFSYQSAPTADVCNYELGIYLMRRSDLLEVLTEAERTDEAILNRALIGRDPGNKRIFGYRHSGFCRIIQGVPDYFAANMQLLDPAIRADLFVAERPIYTRIKDTIPTFYDYNAATENTLIADGCVIQGTVRNSVIFRDVIVEEGAVVENSVIMQNTKICKGASLFNAVVDKKAVVGPGAVLRGSPSHPFILGKGKRV